MKKAEKNFNEETSAVAPSEAGEELRAARSLLEIISHSTPDLIFSKDRAGRITYVNNATCRVLGRTRAEIMGKTELEFLGDNDFSRTIVANDRRIMESGVAETLDEVGPDGARIFQITKTPQRNSRGEVVGLVAVGSDVTERRKVEQALRDSEQQLRAVIETTPECVKIVAADGTLLHMNPSGLTMVDADCFEMVSGKNIYDVIASEHREKFRLFNERICRGEKGVLEFDIIGLRGTRRTMETHAAPLRRPDGSIVQLALTRDITERKRGEEELRLSRLRKSAILESALDCIITMDHEGKIVHFNPAAERTFGYTFEQVQGKAVADLIIPERFREAHWRGLQRFHQTGEGPLLGKRVEIFAQRSDGTEFPVELSISTTRRPDQPAFFTAYLRDITERKRAEAALQESESRYRTLFNSIDEGFCVIEMLFDENGRPSDYCFLEVNPSFERQTGLRNAIGKRMRELIPSHEAHWFETYGKVALTGEPVRFTNEAKAMNRWYDVYAFRLGGEESRKVALLFNDVTERKRASKILEATVSERTAELAESVKFLENLNYTIAHDLRAPLRAMKSYSQILMEETPLNEQGKEYASRICQSADRMDDLVNDLLNYSELSHQNFPLRNLDLKTEIQKVLSHLAEEIKEKSAEIQLREPLPKVKANETLLEQVLTNLVCNALKFVAPGVTPRVKIWAEAVRINGLMEEGISGQASNHRSIQPAARDSAFAPGFVRLWIEDNGIGIQPEYQGKIFGVFQRLHRADEFPGTGAGLAITKRAVEKMGGRVGMESEAGKGSRFWIELPGFPRDASHQS